MSAVDLSLDVIAFHAGALVLEIEYSLDLFDRITVERFAGHFERLLREAIAAPERPVSELPFPSAEVRDAVNIDCSAGDPGPTPRPRVERVPARSAAAPRLITDIERVLLPIWQESLGVTEIGTRDDFFELGGQSLMAVHLVAEAERQLGGTIPLGWIFEHPTVEQLAAAIEARPLQVSRGPEFLIPIRASGTLPPLFCIHGVAGGVFAYREVARLLDLEQPVYGIMLVGRPVERIPRSVEAMAERYIDEMRSVQAQGPYRLLGYSFGCLVAYEMARQIEANGEMVDLVGLVAPPRKLPALRPVWRLLRRRAIHARSQRAPSITSICMSATYSYRPLPYAGRIVFFRAEGAGSGGERLWSRLAAGRLEVRRVPGDHLTIMRSHNAPEFARELRLALGIPASETG
ncbi:MAG: thioesterase domain-containing protein [Gemmatimonadota bacterium]